MVTKNALLTFLAIVFFIHGALYFFVPEDIHNDESPIKYIKYVVLLIFILVSIFENLPAKMVFFGMWIPLFFYYTAFNSLGSVVNFVAYMLPVYLLFSVKHLQLINWRKVILWSITVCSLLGYIEIFLLDNHFYFYNATKDEYRLVSIFLNPNNTGITMALMTMAYVMFYSNNPVKSLIVLLNGSLIVFLTVSKTAFAVFGLLLVYLVIRWLTENPMIRFRAKYFLYFALAIPVMLFGISKFIRDFDFTKIRSISWETLAVRFQGNAYFLNVAAQNPLFPWIKSGEELDNIYFHIWGSFGLLALILFALCSVYFLISIKSKDALIYYLCFVMIGFSTNYIYLWPLGYIFWAIVALSMASRSTDQTSDDLTATDRI